MELTGYMCQVSFDGQTMTARGTNRASHAALVGPGNDGDLVLPVDQATGVELRDATRLVNGRLTVTDSSGTRHVLHFRRKGSEGFRELAAQLSNLVEQPPGRVHP